MEGTLRPKEIPILFISHERVSDGIFTNRVPLNTIFITRYIIYSNTKKYEQSSHQYYNTR